MKRVLITGVSGFIGSHVAELFKSQGFSVTGLVRNINKPESIYLQGIEVINGDIRDKKKLMDIIKGFDGVIHIAGYVKDWGKYNDFYENNITGALNVLEACKINRISKIIFTSSCAVYGEENNLTIKNEHSPHNSHYRYFLDFIFPSAMNYYRDTKKTAKEKCLCYAESHHLNLIFIEPVWVFGPREFNTGFFDYVKTAQKMPFMPGTTVNKFHTVYVKDLANAYLLAFNCKLEGIHSFLIGSKKADKMRYLFELFCQEAGVAKPFLLPKFFFYPVAFILEAIFTIFQIKKPPFITRGRVNMFFDNIEYSIQKAEEILGFKPKYSLEAAVKETMLWYKENRLI